MNIYYFILLLATVIWLGIFLTISIFTKATTVYEYDFDTLVKKDESFGEALMNKIKARGGNGWKYVGCEEVFIHGASSTLVMVTFVKSRMKFRLL